VSPPRDERAGPVPVNPFINPRAGSILGKKRGGPGRGGRPKLTARGGALLGWIHRLPGVGCCSAVYIRQSQIS